jgi:folylpolyglutamate synthase/dihydropteroate synthase
MPTKLKARPSSVKQVSKRVVESRHTPSVTPSVVKAVATKGKTTTGDKGAALVASVKAPEKKLIPVIKELPAKPAAAPSEIIPAFTKALKFLQTLTDYERQRIVRYNTDTFNLDRMRQLLKKLDNPQSAFRSVHIGGTKGKGSTVAMTANMLQSCGYKVGTYTSPHMCDIRERIQINGVSIEKADKFLKDLGVTANAKH